ncbi:MAG: hypothetical protein M3Y34_08065 [Actinomycetota bacterium]|nr:hypothetical protein [Actinomycetota bacterium]
MGKFRLILVALLAVALLAPAQAQAFKPEIVYVRATDDNEGVRFTAKVRMDKGGRDERKVSITYKGERKRAHPLDDPPLSHYQTGPFSIPVRDCYRGVEVRARNRFGVTKRTMRAELIGTNGCG